MRWDPWVKVPDSLIWISRTSVLRGDLAPEKLPLSSTPAYNMSGLKHEQIRKSRAKDFV